MLGNQVELWEAMLAVAGPIGFVGLLVPHIVRLAVGPMHAALVPRAAAAEAEQASDDVVAGPHRRDVRADRLDDAGAFMAEHDRPVEREAADAVDDRSEVVDVVPGVDWVARVVVGGAAFSFARNRSSA